MKRIFTFILITLCFASCATIQTIELYPRKKPITDIEDRYVFLMIIDGPRVDDMEKLVREGRLPTIRETFFEKGARYRIGTTVFPTTSTPGHQAIMSGLLPGRNGIPGISWLDRSNKKVFTYLRPGGLKHLQSDLFNYRTLFNPNAQFTDTPQTLYTALSGQPTFNSFEQVAAGATTSRPTFLLPYGWEYLLAQNYEYADFQAAQITLDVLSKTSLEKFPRLTAVAFYTLDMLLHFEAPLSERVVYAYQHLDVFLRELKTLLQKKGILDKSIFVFTGDHGFHITKEKKISLGSLLIKEGISATDSTKLKGVKAVVTGRRIGTNAIYLKSDPEWKKSATLDDWEKIPSRTNPNKNILETFIEHPSIGLLAGLRKQGYVEVRTKKGRAKIFHSRIGGEDYYQYQVPGGFEDPFTHPSKRHRQTYTSPVYRQKDPRLFEGNDQPDILVLASSLFEDGRAAGLFVSLAPGWNMRIKKLGTHGSFKGEDIRVPLWFSGSGIKPGLHSFARTVDIYPTLLTLFGLEVDRRNIDGRILTEILQSPPLVRRVSSQDRSLAQMEMMSMRQGKAMKITRGLKAAAQKELKRRIRIENNLKNWKQALTKDYGTLLTKNSAKAQKARQLARSLDHALERAKQERARMQAMLNLTRN